MRYAVNIVLIVVVALVLAFVIFGIWVRVAPNDAAYWHVDPATAPDPTSPNFARVDRVTSLAPEQAAAAIAAQAQREGATRIAGDDQFGTWIARTRVMGYPDFISLRLIPEGSGTRVIAFSRSRFGHSDMGVNSARLRRWTGSMPE
ncbi:DUF1499 domain-containing protein [Pararhodobacter sp.]|uniref:DUF1499 domain-containing protein n=1 Tax=Pararhodobacter sp. TaxID=2127056 RepID=UPI002AFE7338|nr:DUF1499 domain-containing protein [Pararhodobacter sp.]